jgi:hypothetical protein
MGDGSKPSYVRGREGGMQGGNLGRIEVGTCPRFADLAACSGPVRLASAARRTKAVNGDRAVGFRVILTTGLAVLYLAGCLAALSLLAGIWGYSF